MECLKQIQSEIEILEVSVQQSLDVIVDEVNRQCFGGTKNIVIQAVNSICSDIGLPEYHWDVNVATGQSERIVVNEHDS